MMHSETPTAVERDEEPATVPPRSTEETEALLAEERHRAQLEFFEHHRQIADLTSLARVDKAELERLRKTASEASKRIARLEEELAAERERSNALAAIRKWHGELGTLRDAELTTVTAARDALERYRIRKASRTLAAVEGSVAYRLSRVLGDAIRSPAALLELPKALASVVRDRWQRRTSGNQNGIEHALAAYTEAGFSAFLNALLEWAPGPADEALAFERLAATLKSDAPALAAIAVREACAADATAARLRSAALGLLHYGEVSEAAKLLDNLAESEIPDSDRRKIETIRQWARWSEQLPSLAEIPTYGGNESGARILYVGSLVPPSRPAVLHQARDWLGILHGNGMPIAALARPQSLRYRFGKGLIDPVGPGNAVRFEELLRVARAEPLPVFLEHAVESIVAAAQEHVASVIYCPSDPDIALPALIAARNLGIAFVYDMRVVQERSLFYDPPARLDSELARLRAALERHVARHADFVYAGSEALRTLLVEAGAEPERVATFPSCIGRSALPSHQPAASSPFIVGFAGPLSIAEGADVVLEAIARLASRGLDVEAHFIGDGELTSTLRRSGERLGIAERVRYVGRKAWTDTLHLFAGMHAVVFPCRPRGIADLTAPAELVHVMGMGLPVAASDLPGFALEIDDGVDGRLFAPGAPDALASVLEEWAKNPELRARIGTAASEKARTLRRQEAYAEDASEFLRTRIPPGRRFRPRLKRGSRTSPSGREQLSRGNTLAQDLLSRLDAAFPFDSVSSRFDDFPLEPRPRRVIVGLLRPSSSTLADLYRPLRIDQGLFVPGLDTAAFVFDATVVNDHWGWEGCLTHLNNHANLALVKLLRAAKSRNVPTVLLYDLSSKQRPFFADFAAEFDFRFDVAEEGVEGRLLELVHGEGNAHELR